MTTESFIAARQRLNDLDGILVFLVVDDTSLTAPARLVNDTRAWVSNGETYSPFSFRFTFPQDVAGESAGTTLEIDNVGRDLTADLENLPPNAVLSATIFITDRSDPDLIEWSWTAPMTRISIDSMTLSASVGVDYIMRQQAVRLRHDPTVSPGIFQE